MSRTETYLGNINLKRSNVTVEYTAHEIQEFIKCSRDPIYFAENYVQIVHVDRGLIPFVPYDYQKDIIDLSIKERFVICKMPRQVGKTTTVVGIILWHILFMENYSIAVLANKLSQAREILGRIQLAYEHLPKWLQQGVVEWNKGYLELENGSKIIASATSSSAIRGTSQNLIYLDEFAFVPNNLQEEFFNSVYPTISSGQTTKVIITSTPNGLNMFYKLWHDSEEGRNDYKRIDVHWSDVPGRDEKWKEETIRNTSEEQFRQEFECEFLGSSHTLIDGTVLRRLVHSLPIQQTDTIKIYEHPFKYDPDTMSDPAADGLYCICVDTSRGVGGDFSVFVVFNVTKIPYTVAAVYRSNIVSPLLYPNFIFQMARHYNNAFVLVETNDIGGQVADILHQEFEYENIVYSANNGKGGQIITTGFGQGSYKGVRTTKTVKRIGCSTLKTLIESDKLIINDYELLQELFRFAEKGQSYEAEDGHDDIVMCCVLFAWMSTQPYFKEITNGDIRHNLFVQNQKAIEESLTPFGFIEDGREGLETAPIVNLEHMSFEQWMAS